MPIFIQLVNVVTLDDVFLLLFVAQFPLNLRNDAGSQFVGKEVFRSECLWSLPALLSCWLTPWSVVQQRRNHSQGSAPLSSPRTMAFLIPLLFQIKFWNANTSNTQHTAKAPTNAPFMFAQTSTLYVFAGARARKYTYVCMCPFLVQSSGINLQI